MVTKSDLMQALRETPPAKQFVPYCFISSAADALTFYFEGDPDYSERLNDHVTLYRSIATNELVGCRIKGIKGILDNLPNFIEVDHDDIKLSAIFLPFWSSTEDEGREHLKALAKSASERRMIVDRCLA